MTRLRAPFRPVTVALAAAVCLVPFLSAAPATAGSADVVISELMYHAPDDDAQFNALEFIELTNSGAGAIDLGGWSFTAGITVATGDLKLPPGLVIPAGGRLVGTNDPGLFTAKYGFAADFSYLGSSLSNGGETVTLVDSAAAVADTVTYDDAAPWVVSPDGGGPSLELSDLSLDNSVATSWHASSAMFGSPRAANSVAPLPLTAITPAPANPAAGQPVVLRATAPVGSTLQLTYKVMYGADVTVPMLDDDASPGGAGDGVYAATIPGAGQGELIRYKVAASKGSSSAAYPAVGDSRPYDGLVVQDTELNAAQWPVIQWFMSDATYQDMIQNHRCDDYRASATMAYNGVVLDGVMMKIKGHSTCTDAKAKWDVELPEGYTFTFGAPFLYPLKKFDMQNENMPVPRLGWEMIGDSGEVTPKYQSMRVQRNGSFFGNFGILENYDGTWRSNNGYGDAEFYKIEDGGLRTYATPAALAASLDIDKKNPDDGDLTSLWALTQKLAEPDSADKRTWMRANVDLPQLANYTALTVVMRHWDSGAKNFYVTRDRETNRWQILSWDLDDILNNAADPKGDFIFPNTDRNRFYRSLWELPEFRVMHFRRLRELYDVFYDGNRILDRFDALTVPYANDIARDAAAWGTRSLTSRRNRLIDGIQERRNQITAHTNATEIPTSQSAGPAVVLNELQYAPGPGGSEYLEAYNPSTTEAVDLSGWTVPALNYVVAPGTVLPPKGFLAWVKDDAGFTAAYGGGVSLMAGQYPGDLADAGEEVSLLDGTRVVDTVTYAPSAPWPSAPNGTGPSLELIDPASDNASPTSWAASTSPALNGTPGAVNSVSAPTGPVTSTVLPYGSTWRYLSTSTSPGTGWRATTFNDSAWPSGPASLGFRSVQTTTIPSAAQRWTYYFRSHFTVPAGASPTGVTLNLRRDDGAVVYVNGVEVARSNMPTGTITNTTRASSAIGTGSAVQATVTIALPPSALVAGDNVIAVEVHQYYATTTADLYLDAQLNVTR